MIDKCWTTYPIAGFCFLLVVEDWVVNQLECDGVERIGDVIDTLPSETLGQLIDGLSEIID